MEKYGGKNIQYVLNGLRCDQCNWVDENIPLDDFDKWLDKPCPKCGAIVLTHEQLGHLYMMLEIADVMNQLDIPIDPNEPMAEMNLLIDSSANIKLNIKNLDGKKKGFN
jgi:phage FluMu protein Com